MHVKQKAAQNKNSRAIFFQVLSGPWPYVITMLTWVTSIDLWPSFLLWHMVKLQQVEDSWQVVVVDMPAVLSASLARCVVCRLSVVVVYLSSSVTHVLFS